jgi:hypothetical protein
MAKGIVIRGFHDAGKTTLAKSLIKYFNRIGKKAILYQFEKAHHGLVPNRFYKIPYGMVPNSTISEFGRGLIKGFDYYIFEIREPVVSSPTRSVAVDLFKNQYVLHSKTYLINLPPKISKFYSFLKTQQDLAKCRIGPLNKKFYTKEDVEKYFLSLFDLPRKNLSQSKPNIIEITLKEKSIPFDPVYIWRRKDEDFAVDVSQMVSSIKTNSINPEWNPKKTDLKVASVGGIHGEWDFIFDVVWFDTDIQKFCSSLKYEKYDLAIIGGFSNIDVFFKKVPTDIPIICYHPSLFSRIFALKVTWQDSLPPSTKFCPRCWDLVYLNLKNGKLPIVPPDIPCYGTEICYAVLNNEYIAWSCFDTEGMQNPIEIRQNVMLLKYFIHPYHLIESGWIKEFLGV